jgi:hypothetical protein
MSNGAPIKTWLVESILVTLFCCMPLGIVAIVFSALAMRARDSGNMALAQQRAGTAKLCTLIGFGVGLVVIIAYAAMVFLGVAGGVAGAAAGSHP